MEFAVQIKHKTEQALTLRTFPLIKHTQKKAMGIILFSPCLCESNDSYNAKRRYPDQLSRMLQLLSQTDVLA